MSWYGTILTVEHFVHQKSVTVGNTKKSNFAIPPLLSSNYYPIVTQTRQNFILNIDSQMKGVIQKKGELKSLDEWRGTVMKGTYGYEVPFGKKDFAKISIGEIDFYLSSTSAPPRLKRRRLLEKDPFFFKIFSTSLILTLGLLYTLSKIQLPKGIEVEQVPERIATILYQPENFMRPPPIPPAIPVEQTKPIAPSLPLAPAPRPTETVRPKLSSLSETKKPLPKEMDYQRKSAQKKQNPVVPHHRQHPHPQLQPHPCRSNGSQGGGGGKSSGSRGFTRRTES
jgi:hypothetical protein